MQRGRLNTDLGLQLDSVQSLVKAREIGYAFSNSLRFVFFWIFTAQPPKAERDTPNARAGTHSGNWGAWGFVGIILQWLTLGLIIVIFALQVVWRLDSRSDEFIAAYSAESTIEVLLSVIFAFKLLLNCAHCTIASKWTCIVDYLGFIISLLFSVGFGVANLTHREFLFGSILAICDDAWHIVKFTETVLGRFLQGINFYLLVLFSLLAVFLPPWKFGSGRVPPFRPLSPKQPTSSFDVAPPDVSTPNLSAVQPQLDSPVIRRSPSDRPSSTTRISGWLATQRQRLSSLSHRGVGQDDMNVQLWNQIRAERGLSLWEEPSKDPDVFRKAYGYPDSYLGTDPVQLPPIEKPKLEAPRLGTGLAKSRSSCYLNADLSLPEPVDRKSWQLDSPVFGLNGIVRPSTGESGLRSPGSVTVTDQDGTSDISGLFRKQEELDNSIAALKLLGGSAGLPSSPSSSKQSEEPSATRSDFSLSNFPDPPWVDSPESSDLGERPRSPSSVGTARVVRFNRPSVSVDNIPFDLIPTPASMMEHHRTLSLPVSETADSESPVSARTPRFDSQGTQYDVTSFIGSGSLG